jgi:Xaa-Pro aminopeptidase
MIADRVKMLRKLMANVGIDAYLVPCTDEHHSEYVPPCWQRLAWISGFTGSAGTVVITPKVAGLWTDGRYHLQAAEQLDDRVYSLFPVGIPDIKEVNDWLSDELPEGHVVGVDPKLISVDEARKLSETIEARGKTVRYLEENLIDQLWNDRPDLPMAPVHILPEIFSGESVASKMDRLREKMDLFQTDAHLASALDAVAWLFNLRGKDIPYNPVFIAYALITHDRAQLFVHPDKLNAQVRESLQDLVTFHPYAHIKKALAECASRGWRVWIDPASTSQWVLSQIQDGGKPFKRPSPLAHFKSLKNPVEQAGLKSCHIRDGAAVVRFLRWLEEQLARRRITERSAAQKLESLRDELDFAQGPSFQTIVGYEGHGAIIHYAPSEDTDCELRPSGLLLVDSGGQYSDGTTDVTRTLALGEPSQEQKNMFTRVLQGHIQLAMARFPKGTTGKRLDVLARRPLWEVGLDYRHGTGHGIGAYLNVHEGPQSLSPKAPDIPLEPGMVLSNEPGYYKEGEYGIRIENAMLVAADESTASDYGPFYRFEVLTMAPIDLRLVEPAHLTTEERRWLNEYHASVYTNLSALLVEADQHWLKAATCPI